VLDNGVTLKCGGASRLGTEFWRRVKSSAILYLVKYWGEPARLEQVQVEVLDEIAN
jgi:hypothetical protein